MATTIEVRNLLKIIDRIIFGKTILVFHDLCCFEEKALIIEKIEDYASQIHLSLNNKIYKLGMCPDYFAYKLYLPDHYYAWQCGDERHKITLHNLLPTRQEAVKCITETFSYGNPGFDEQGLFNLIVDYESEICNF